MKVFQESLVLSPHLSLYDMLIPKDHFLRQMNELVDFSFINEALAGCYSNEMGRLPIPPIQMFKYLLLKELSNLSDRDLMERARYDLSYKYFLDLAPEDPVADYTTLSKFRTIRLKDVRLLNTLIQKTADIALELGIIKSKTMLVDSTHSKSRFQAYSRKIFCISVRKSYVKRSIKLMKVLKNLCQKKSKQMISKQRLIIVRH